MIGQFATVSRHFTESVTITGPQPERFALPKLPLVRALFFGHARTGYRKASYFPMQNVEKILPSKSSLVNSPVISFRCL